MSNFSNLNFGIPIDLRIPVELYDNWIMSDFPTFQKQNRSSQSSSVVIDFSQCEWVSPLPLLALLVEIISYSDSDRCIDIDLGGGAGTDKGAYNRARTRVFLSCYGFLSAFKSRDDLSIRFQFDKTEEYGTDGCWYDTKPELQTLRSILERSMDILLYGSAIVLPATVWKLPNFGPDLSENIREQVQQLLHRADTQLFKFKTEARKYRDVTLQRLTQVLLELIENAAEHAYSNNIHKYVGIYVRVRQTLNEDASKARKKELSKSPLLSKILLNEKHHQIEVFVLDVGEGLFNELNTWQEEELENIPILKLKHPLQATSSILFKRPLSKHNRKENSVLRQRGNSTGLMHLHNILSHQNDSTRIITGHEWLAGPHPRPQGFLEDTISPGGHRFQENPIKGTFFHVVINFAVIPELDAQWFVSDKAENEEVRKSIINNFANLTRQSTNQSKNKVINIRGIEGLKNVGISIKNIAKEESITMIRVRRITDKNLINKMIYSWVEGVGEFQGDNPSLYLCDLGRFQSIDVIWVIKNLFKGNEEIELKNIPSEATIFLVTEDLCCTELKFRFSKHPRGNNLYSIKSHQSNIDIKTLEKRLVYTLEQLRYCDTKMLWNRIDSLNTEWRSNPVIISVPF